jgi:hypothetical protein
MSSGAAFVTSTGTHYFDGIEWDLEYVVERNMVEVPVIGSAPKLIETFLTTNPQDFDCVDATFTMWGSAAQMASIEATLPAYGDGQTFDFWLMGIAGNAAIPGFGQYASPYWKFVACTLNDSIESMGQKAPRVDLYGYRIALHFSGNGGDSHLNERSGDSPGGDVVPSVLSKKFIAHQVQDESRSAKPLPMSSGLYASVQHGRRFDGGMSLDHLTPSDMDTVIWWFRAARGAPFTLTSSKPFGPNSADTVSAVARKLVINRGAGFWWDARLDLSKV